MSGDDFETRYLTAMHDMLQTAAAETRRIFEMVVGELKEEMSRVQQENQELRSKCGHLEERLTRWPQHGGHEADRGHKPGPGTQGTRDTGVQCDLCCNTQFRNSLPQNMEQEEDDQKRGDLQNQQLCNIYGEGHVHEDGIQEPALVHKKVQTDVTDSVTPLEKGQTVDCNTFLMTGNMLCNIEKVEEYELESPPRADQSQKLPQQVLRVDETMAKEDNVTMQASVNVEVISEQPIQLSEEVCFSIKGASCNSEVDVAEIGVNFETDSSAQINKRRSLVDGKVQSPPVNLDNTNCSSIISAATPRRGRPPKKASLFELHTQPEPDTNPRMRRPLRKSRCRVTQVPLQGTMSPPPSSGVPPAKGASNTPSEQVKLGQDSCVLPFLAASLTKGRSSEDEELSGIHQVSKEMEEKDLPSAAEPLEAPLLELPKSKSIGPRKPSHNPNLQEALQHGEASSLPTMTVPAQPQNTAGFTSSNASLAPSLSIPPVSPQTTTTDRTWDPSFVVCKMANSLPTLDQSTKGHYVPPLPLGPRNAVVSASAPSAVFTSKTNAASETTHKRSCLQHTLTSISPVVISNDRLGNISETKVASSPAMTQGKSSNYPEVSTCAEENAAYLNTSSASEGLCVMDCGQKDLPTTLTEVPPSTVALTRSTLTHITESCSVSKTLPLLGHSSSSLNKAFTKGCAVKALKQVSSAAPNPLFNDTVNPHSQITKTMFFAQLSMAPVVHLQEKALPKDLVDCVVAEATTHNTRSRFRKCRKRLKEPRRPSLSSAETTSKPTKVSPKVGDLDTDEYSTDDTKELDAVSAKYNANKNCRLSQERTRPKESVSLVNNTSTRTVIKTTAVWTPPILETSKLLRNDNCFGRIPTKWAARSAVPKRRRSPSTASLSCSNGSLSALRTARYSHRGTSRPTPVQPPSEPFSVIGERLLRNQRGRVLSSTAALQRHVGVHSGQRPFSCALCSQSFPDSKALSRHGRVHHNGKIFICPQCNEGFAYRFGLTKHLQTVHSRIKPFVCQICHKGYFRRKDVESHLRVHSEARQFPCNLCDKRFNRRVELNVHLRDHSRDKRHRCPFCGKEFLDYNNLKRHKYTHTGERPYSCPHCTKSFVQSGHLKKHLRNVHMVDVYADSQ